MASLISNALSIFVARAPSFARGGSTAGEWGLRLAATVIPPVR